MYYFFLQSNVIAQEAVACVNHRVHPAQTIEQVNRRVFNYSIVIYYGFVFRKKQVRVLIVDCRCWNMTDWRSQTIE